MENSVDGEAFMETVPAGLRTSLNRTMNIMNGAGGTSSVKPYKSS